jgi:hypothetical protein
MHSNSLEETLDKWTEEIRKEARQINIEIARKLKGVRQGMYSTDAKKTIQLLTKDRKERLRTPKSCSWQCAGLMCQIAWGHLSPRSLETPVKSSASDLNPVGYP